jgi:hypothetical protein
MRSEDLPTCRGSHRGPVIVSPTGDEKYRARCLACNTVGPARETSEKAYEALRNYTLGSTSASQPQPKTHDEPQDYHDQSQEGQPFRGE